MQIVEQPFEAAMPAFVPAFREEAHKSAVTPASGQGQAGDSLRVKNRRHPQSSVVYFHSELENSHRLTQRANLPHPRSVWDDRILADPTQTIGGAELRRVQRVERFGAEL